MYELLKTIELTETLDTRMYYTVVRKDSPKEIWSKFGRNIRNIYCLTKDPTTEEEIAKKLFQNNTMRSRRYCSILKIFGVVRLYQGNREVVYKPKILKAELNKMLTVYQEAFLNVYYSALYSDKIEILQLPEMQLKRIRFYNSFVEICNNLLNPVKLIRTLYNLRENQANKGLTNADYDAIEKALLSSIRFCYNENWNTELSHLWKCALTLWIDILRPNEPRELENGPKRQLLTVLK